MDALAFFRVARRQMRRRNLTMDDMPPDVAQSWLAIVQQAQMEYWNMKRNIDIVNTPDLRRAFQAFFDIETELFKPSGTTHDGTIAENSSSILPEPEELRRRSDKQFTYIERQVPTTGEYVVVAATPYASQPVAAECAPNVVGDSEWHADQWMMAYRWGTRLDRASMLDIDDPMKMTSDQVDAILLRAQSPTTTTTRMTAPTATGVQTSIPSSTSTGRQRVRWNGHSAFSLARWMGAVGWPAADAIHVFRKLGMTTFGESAIKGGVYAGSKGQRGEPASVTVDQARYLESQRPNPNPILMMSLPPTSATSNAASSTGSTVLSPRLTLPVASGAEQPAKKSRVQQKLDRDFKALMARKAAKKSQRKGK